MKLYGSLTSPYVRKVRILLAEKNLACAFVPEGASDPGSHVPQFNPLGKVPVMLLDNGKSLYDSALLVEYLDALKAPHLIPSGEARWDVQRWHYLAMGVVDAVIARMLELRRPADKQLPEAVAKQEQKVARALAVAEATEKGEFLVGEFGLADIALGVALDYIDLRYAHDWRTGHPRLAQWLDAIHTRASFIATAPPR